MQPLALGYGDEIGFKRGGMYTQDKTIESESLRFAI